MIYQGYCSFVIPNKKNPAYKLRSKKANYRRGLKFFKFPDNTLFFLEDALEMAKEIQGNVSPLRKQVLTIQYRTVLNKLIPKFVLKEKGKGESISELEQAISYYKALQLRESIQIREKYFRCLTRAINTQSRH